jgi:Flp pilus assembly pilin Flp
MPAPTFGSTGFQTRQTASIGTRRALAGMAMMMDRMRVALTPLRVDRSGATSIEYALIAVFISILVVGWAAFVGTAVSDFFTQVGNGF